MALPKKDQFPWPQNVECIQNFDSKAMTSESSTEICGQTSSYQAYFAVHQHGALQSLSLTSTATMRLPVLAQLAINYRNTVFIQQLNKINSLM